MSSVPSQSETSRKIVENMYQAAMGGDVAGFFSYFADELEIIEPSFLPYGGKHHGVAGLQALFGEFTKYLNIGSLQVESIIADGETVRGFLRFSTASGDSEVQLAERSIVRNGKIVELKIFVHELGSMKALIRR